MAFDKSRRRKHTSTASVVSQAVTSFLALASISNAAWSLRNARTEQAPLLPSLSPPRHLQPKAPPVTQPSNQRFTLRHTFARGLYEHPDVHKRLDVKQDEVRLAAARTENDGSEDGIGPLDAQPSPVTIQRLRDRRVSEVTSIMATARQQGSAPRLPEAQWSMDEVYGPNVTDRTTVINMALMAANAYDETRDESEWTDVDPPFNLSKSFGWHKDSLRGHVFADDINGTIVIAIKGTSSAVFDGAGTTTNDKVNDNLFFSCCCGQGGHLLWLKVCSCMKSAYTCNENCLITALKDKSMYYHKALDLYGNVTEMYPEADVWLTGHSLGGAVASLLGLTFGLPVVTFQAVPEALPAGRLGLPVPPGYVEGLHQRRKHTGAYHFGHTADPVYMGTCNTLTSFCTLAFYAMESVCHTGHRCVWDTVGDLSWSVSLTTHPIRSCIADVYTQYKTLPRCERDEECRDCGAWKFFKGNGSEGTAPPSSISITTFTRTETCETPGWWGCLDSSTTPLTTATTTITTTTCTSWGWFGNCLDDPVTTTLTSTATIPVTATPHSTITNPPATPPPTAKVPSSTTSTCETPGWFWGCWDTTSAPNTTPATTPKPSTSSSSSQFTTCSCQYPGILWGCWDLPRCTTLPATAVPTTCVAVSTCHEPGLLWGCWDKATRTEPGAPQPTTCVPLTSTCHHPGLLWGCWDPSAAVATPTLAQAAQGMQATLPTITPIMERAGL